MSYRSLTAGMSWSKTEGSHVLRQDGRFVGDPRGNLALNISTSLRRHFQTLPAHPSCCRHAQGRALLWHITSAYPQVQCRDWGDTH